MLGEARESWEDTCHTNMKAKGEIPRHLWKMPTGLTYNSSPEAGNGFTEPVGLVQLSISVSSRID